VTEARFGEAESEFLVDHGHFEAAKCVLNEF
jgi:hypothetical protein